MASESKYFTLMLISSETAREPKSLKLSYFAFRLLVGVLILLLVALIFLAVTYPMLLSRAGEQSELVQENEELRRLNSKVELLEQHLQAYRVMLKQVTTLAGIDLADYGLDFDSVPGAGIKSELDPAALQAAFSDLPQPIPTGLPVQGFMSRAFRPNDDNPRTRHSGVDIAVASGTPVRATADGKVTFAGWDEVFGWTIMMKHADSVETIYGHNDSLLVNVGDSVSYGRVIALSGNTGTSTAPHVHYEIRINGNAVNPEGYDAKSE